MRSKAPALLVLLILMACPLAQPATPHDRANQEGNTFVAITASSFSASPLHIGDQNVTVGITVRNLRSSDGNASNGDERLYNVKASFGVVKDAAGQNLTAPSSPLVWDVQTVDNGEGYTLGYTGEMNASQTFAGFQFDVRGIGARPGVYNISFTISYTTMVSWNALEGAYWSGILSESCDNVRIEVASNVAVGAPVAYTDALTPMSLYSGTGFQLIGIPIRTLSGALTNVTGTLSVPGAIPFHPVISAGAAAEAFVGRLTSTSTLYFRIDVPHTDPGVYGPSNGITLTLRYTRETNWNSQVENIIAGEDGMPLTFTVEYTPLLDAVSAPMRVVRGTDALDVPVDLKNTGNADLVRLEVVLGADADFSPSDYHYDGNGNRVAGLARCDIDSLVEGLNTTAVFHLAVYPNAPAGVHRLELSYSGYFHNKGMTGASSGYYPVTDALCRQLKGALPHIDIEVVSAEAAVALVSSPSSASNINPGGESEGVNIWLTVRNDEHFGLLDARVTILAGPGTPIVNPTDASAVTLAEAVLPRIAAGQQAYMSFEANLNTSLSPGLHRLVMVFNATGEDSGAALGSQAAFFIRTGPFGPDLGLEAGNIARAEAGAKDVVIPVTVRNTGSASLGGVLVRLACGSGTPISDPAGASSTSIVRDIGALGPGGAATVEFVVDVYGSAEARTHVLGVAISGSYFASGEPFAKNGSISFRVHASPPALVVLDMATSPAEIIPGRPFTLSFVVRNVGGERAAGVWAGMTGLGGAGAFNATGGPGPSGLPGEVPFSADVAVKFIGNIEPGQQVNVSFSMLSDVWAGRGRTYQQPLLLSYEGMDTGAQSQQFAIAVRTKAAAAPAEPPKDWMPTILLVVLIVIVLLVLVAIAMPRRTPPGPLAGPETEKASPPPLPETRSPAPAPEPPSQVAVAVPLQTPPPPPPGYSEALAQSQPLPPPPAAQQQPAATAMRVEGGAAASTRPGPLEGYAIPGADDDQPRYSAPPQKPKAYSGKEVPMRNCPTCGNEVKVRFVKCPYCGSDLPPVS